MTGALHGLTVLDLTAWRAGALCTMTLADHGARVLRIIGPDEPDFRDGGFIVWDRGKETLRAPEKWTSAAEQEPSGFADLVRMADILVEDCAPSARPAHLTHQALAAHNPRIVSCSITTYGNEGAYRDEPPDDDLVMARSGLLAGLPGFRAPPVHLVHPLPSTGGALLAALGIAAALYDREETGRGRPVATSLLAGALLYQPKVSAERLTRNAFQTNPYGSAPFYSVYACSDDAWVQLGCVHPGFIARAAALMGISDVLADPVYGRGQLPQTPEADAHLRALLTEILATRSYDDWAKAFEENDIPFAKARFTEDGFDDPQIRHNQMVATLDDPVRGPVDQMGVAVKLSRTPGKVGAPRSTPHALADLEAGQPDASQAGTTDQDTQRKLPLSGVRVLEITNLIAGPIAGRLLADLGADVMKLEPPAGDISRPIGRTYFYSVNFAKRSICVDTSNDEGKALVRTIAASSDVLLANLRPGATNRMGIGVAYDTDLVETQISGYGLTGPYATRPGIDPLAQAMMGLERAQGGAGNPPSFPAQLAPTDFTTGTAAAFGTALALYVRRRDRKGGQRVEVNLLDGGILLSSEWFTRYRGRPERPLADKGQYGLHPLHRLYEVRDGHVYLAGKPEQATALADALGISCPSTTSESEEAGDHPNATAAAQAFEAAFARIDVSSALAALAKAAISAAPAETAEYAHFLTDPNTKLNDYAVTRKHAEAGDITVVWHYVDCPGSGEADTLPTPLLGEHSRQILAEAGLDEPQIEQAIENGTVIAR